MTTPVRPRYAGYCLPAEVISHAVWLYFRFPLSLRMVEKMLAARGIIVSITDLKRGTVLWPRAPVIVDPRRGDVGVTEPLLHLGDVGLVIECVGGGARAQRMRPDLEAERGRVGAPQPVDAIRRDRPVQLAG